jgi:hypothetical protein
MSRWEAEQEAQHRELEAAGWRLVSAGEYLEQGVWRRPNSRYLYPQDIALRLVREGSQSTRPRSGAES